MRMLAVTSITALLACSSAVGQVNPAGVKWGPPPPSVPKGAQFAVMAGDPSKPGIFVFRARFPAGYVVPPHHHPRDEFVTVISGQMLLGMGTKVDRARRANLSAGGFIVTKANMNHYAVAKVPTIIQVSGEGPFEIAYVNPKDDPRNAAK